MRYWQSGAVNIQNNVLQQDEGLPISTEATHQQESHTNDGASSSGSAEELVGQWRLPPLPEFTDGTRIGQRLASKDTEARV